MIYGIYTKPITRSWHSPLMPPIDYSQCGTALDSEADAVACSYHYDLQVAFLLVLSLHPRPPSLSLSLFESLSLSLSYLESGKTRVSCNFPLIAARSICRRNQRVYYKNYYKNLLIQ